MKGHVVCVTLAMALISVPAVATKGVAGRLFGPLGLVVEEGRSQEPA